MPEVCDDCIMVAYDLGCNTYEEQSSLMRGIGAELSDHNCEATDEPDMWPDGCGCACRG